MYPSDISQSTARRFAMRAVSECIRAADKAGEEWQARRAAVISFAMALPAPIAPGMRQYIANSAWSSLGYGGGI